MCTGVCETAEAYIATMWRQSSLVKLSLSCSREEQGDVVGKLLGTAL